MTVCDLSSAAWGRDVSLQSDHSTLDVSTQLLRVFNMHVSISGFLTLAAMEINNMSTESMFDLLHTLYINPSRSHPYLPIRPPGRNFCLPGSLDEGHFLQNHLPSKTDV